ncbi:unnamed protein product [Lampetra fluviatilis]
MASSDARCRHAASGPSLPGLRNGDACGVDEHLKDACRDQGQATGSASPGDHNHCSDPSTEFPCEPHTALSSNGAPLENGLHDKHRQSVEAHEQRGKVFRPRSSLLDEMLLVNHIRTIYHIFLAVLLLMAVASLILDILRHGRLLPDISFVISCFGKLHLVALTWGAMFVATLLVPYGALHAWARAWSLLLPRRAARPGAELRGRARPGAELRGWALARSSPLLAGTLSAACALPYVAFVLLVLGMLPVWVSVAHVLPPASRFILILEQVRFVMKAHAFVRDNVPRVALSVHPQGPNWSLPSISQYLYYLFCPSLIYRDSYPRNTSIRWDYVRTKLAEMACIFVYGHFIFQCLVVPLFQDVQREPLTLERLVLYVCHAMVPGTLLFIITFFAFLHCWLNLFGELMRFADRMFYKDWWNSRSFANYYRTWNVVVHDWLYTYFYGDLIRVFSRRHRRAAMLIVFIFSAIVHEYVFTVCFGLFCPVMLFLFICFGMVLNFLLHDGRSNDVWNIFMWFALILGQGVLVTLYSLEWSALRHCPSKPETVWEFITPQFWSCYASR